MRSVLIAIFFALLSVSAQAQSSLSLTDQLPPYRLSAFLLANGHFAISTAYTGALKPLIYREDGTGNRPINYTSHLHVKVDGVVYKMGYEVDEATGAPPPNQITVLGLFRDTVNNRPRVNANMQILHGSGDTLKIVFTMEPVKRSSGAFIRISVRITNRGIRSHDVGVLLLIDTKIGDNDRAPIATSFGYRIIETDYVAGTNPGIPDYWIALEGTPVAPGLTARGNLIETDLVTPDLFVLGNWVDDPNRATIGMRLNEWDERLATGFDYSDSSVLLIWDPKAMVVGASAIRASTEIGLVDSLEVGTGGGAGGDALIVAGPGIGGGSSGCMSVEVNDQVPCSIIPYHPYLPDTLEPLFLVTNNEAQQLNNVSIDVPMAIPGVDVVRASTPVIPSTLDTAQTGVGSIALALRPRLRSQIYNVPIEVRANGLTPPMRDTIAICVPGLQAIVNAFNITTPNLCPTIFDTIGVQIDIDGPRCLPLVEFTVLGTPLATVRIIPPLPFQLSARGISIVPVEVSVPNIGNTSVRVRVRVREFETLVDGDTTFVDHIDTITITIPAKLAEYEVVGLIDTLDMGDVCIGDSLRMDILIQNIGGCDLSLTTMNFSNTAGGRFSVAPNPTVPVQIDRAEIVRPRLLFSSQTSGVFVGTLRLESIARPGVKLIPVKARVVVPDLVVADTLDLDTVCANTDIVRSLPVRSPVACPVNVDSIDLGTSSVTTSATGGFTVPANGQVSVPLVIRRSIDGPFTETITLLSTEAGNRQVVIRGVIGTSSLTTQPLADGGDIRVGTSRTITTTITALGSLPITITALRVLGPSGAEFAVRPAGGATLPITIAAGGSLDLLIDCTPADIESRTAQLFITTQRPPCEPVLPIDLLMRGIRPLLSADRPQLDLGRVCINGAFDTTIVVRNRGNAPLNITGVRVSSPDAVVTSSFPIPLAPDDSADIAVTITSNGLGAFTTQFRIDHDGEFAIAADSILLAEYRGIICGSIGVDTVVGVVGTVVPTTITWIPEPNAPLTLDEVVGHLTARSEGLHVQIAHDELVVRGRTLVGGVVQAPTTNLTVLRDTIDIDAPALQANGSNVIARVEVDLLRGGPDRTVMTPIAIDLASGDADVQLLPGQIRSLLCAYDGRGLSMTGLNIFRDISSRDLIVTGVTSTADLTVYTLSGRFVGSLALAPSQSGIVHIPNTSLPQDNDAYAIVVRMANKTANTILR